MSKFWKVTGETRKKILQVFVDREVAHNKIMMFAKEHGASGYQHATGIADHCCGLVFDEGKEPAEDNKVWRKHYNRKERTHDDWYVPARTSKAGREAATAMSKLRLPGQSAVGSVLGMDWYQLPGYRSYGKAPRQRIVVVSNESYQPTKKVAADLTRISDIEAEKLEHPRKAKRKRRRAKSV